jgi:hypothetical protein
MRGLIDPVRPRQGAELFSELGLRPITIALLRNETQGISGKHRLPIVIGTRPVDQHAFKVAHRGLLACVASDLLSDP